MKQKFYKTLSLIVILSIFLASCTKSSDFGYVEPKRDENGLLLARTDLKKSEEVSDGYKSIKELFTKLNSMDKTQVEPEFKPFYHGEKAPTFIIVGDMHADEYNLKGKDMNYIKSALGKTKLIEENEDANQEIEVIDLLNKKFGLKNIGLENELNNYGEFFSKIGLGVQKLGVNAIGLETEEGFSMLEESMMNSLAYNVAFLKLCIPDISINIKWTPEEIEKFMTEKEILQELAEEDYEDILMKNSDKSKEEKIKILKKHFMEDFEKCKLEKDKDLSIKIVKISRYVLDTMHGEEVEEILKKAKEIKEDNLEKFSEDFAKVIIESDEKVINKRNEIGIDLLTKNNPDENIFVMVYGKAHIDDLIKKLKEKYDSKVNIYVAK